MIGFVLVFLAPAPLLVHPLHQGMVLDISLPNPLACLTPFKVQYFFSFKSVIAAYYFLLLCSADTLPQGWRRYQSQ